MKTEVSEILIKFQNNEINISEAEHQLLLLFITKGLFFLELTGPRESKQSLYENEYIRWDETEIVSYNKECLPIEKVTI